MDILLTFAGNQDPFNPEVVKGVFSDGPVLTLTAQAKILRVLQDKAITRVGGEKTISADVRVIAATNRNLTERIADGKLREDLYYHLRVIDFPVPALRERREDIPLLVEHFLDRHNRRYHQKKQLN